MMPNVIQVKILTGNAAEENAVIPKILLITSFKVVKKVHVFL